MPKLLSTPASPLISLNSNLNTTQIKGIKINAQLRNDGNYVGLTAVTCSTTPLIGLRGKLGIQKRVGNYVGLTALMCSTTPLIGLRGKAGIQKIEGDYVGLTALMCSTTPLIGLRGKVGIQKIEGDYVGLTALMCSTMSLIGLRGKVGISKREGSVSLLSFNNQINDVINSNEDDSDQSLSGLLPFVVVATAIAALSQPSTFTWVPKDLYAPALGGIMLSIGIGLSIKDFALAFQRPVPLSIGLTAQYVLKPVLGVLIAHAFGMSSIFYAGFVLTACVSGAQLSSYASFLSNGDVALSILLTSSSTIASVLFTPLLTRLLIGSVVPVDAVAMSKSILQVVLAPVSLGLLLNAYAKSIVNILQPVMPFVAMVCTSLCIGSPLAINRSQILSAEGLRLIAPVLTFHVAAFTIGYWFSKLPMLRLEEEVSRTISLSTGMQSSTLAGLLATQFLGTSQAVPAACSVVTMAIMGLTIASFWGSGRSIRDLPRLISPRLGLTVKA